MGLFSFPEASQRPALNPRLEGGGGSGIGYVRATGLEFARSRGTILQNKGIRRGTGIRDAVIWAVD